jgi:hypothetical protein
MAVSFSRRLDLSFYPQEIRRGLCFGFKMNKNQIEEVEAENLT